MIVVSNTTPLIGLAAIGRIELLHDLFGEISIAQAVYEEAVTAGREQGGAKREVSTASWIHVVTVQDRSAVERLAPDLDLGEAETIVLAQVLGAAWVLMDERKGRRHLTHLGIAKVGTVGLLLKAKHVGLIPALRPELERLQQDGFRLSPAMWEAVLREAHE